MIIFRQKERLNDDLKELREGPFESFFLIVRFVSPPPVSSFAGRTIGPLPPPFLRLLLFLVMEKVKG